VPAVDQDGQLNRTGTAKVVQGVESCPHGAAGVEHVIDDDDDGPVDALGGHLGGAEGPGRAEPQIVAVHRDVE
jgi:hypothetical protein